MKTQTTPKTSERILLEWKAESNTGKNARFFAVPAFIFCCYALYRAIIADSYWWAPTVLGAYMAFVFIRSFKKEMVTFRLTNKAVLRFRESKGQKALLTYDKKVSNSLVARGNYRPYETINRYVVKENEIILLTKNWFINKFSFSLIPNKNKDKIIKILNKCLKTTP